MKLETHSSLTPQAFSCFHDTIVLVRSALEEIVSQLSVSNCLLVFKNSSSSSRLCKEVITQPTLFHLVANDPESHKFLEEHLFLRTPHLRSCCLFGDAIPASWIRYEVLLEICTELGKDDCFSADQLRNLAENLRANSSQLQWVHHESYESQLNRMLQLLLSWKDSHDNEPVGRLTSALAAVGLNDAITVLQESLPVFVLKDSDEQD